MTPQDDRLELLRLAREAVVAHVTGWPAPAPSDSPALDRPGAVFVTLHHRGELRGCIGHLDHHEPLGRVIVRCAIGACSTDPRFPPVAPFELEQLHVELSILGPLEAIAGPGDIEIGRHGLVVELLPRRGLLLPQVAVEWKWDAETFLAYTCRKAGLPRDAWRNGAGLWRFEAEVFGEP